jgi:hypothetical protein
MGMNHCNGGSFSDNDERQACEVSVRTFERKSRGRQTQALRLEIQQSEEQLELRVVGHSILANIAIRHDGCKCDRVWSSADRHSEATLKVGLTVSGELGERIL